jgi:hypothetical protein
MDRMFFGVMHDEYYYNEGLLIDDNESDTFLLRHKGKSNLTFSTFTTATATTTASSFCGQCGNTDVSLIDEYVSIRDDYGDYITYLHTPKKCKYTEIRDMLMKRLDIDVDTFKLLNVHVLRKKKKALETTGLYKLIAAGIASKHYSLKMQSRKLLDCDKFSDFSNVTPINWRLAEINMTAIMMMQQRGGGV